MKKKKKKKKMKKKIKQAVTCEINIMDHWTENYCEEENNLFF